MLEQHGEVNGFEVRIKKQGGSEIDLLLNARLIKEKGYIEGTLTDINKLKKLEEELKRKNEEMEAFIYSVSHDLKSPIYTVSGFVELLKSDDIEIEKRNDFFSRIHQNLEEMSIFISGLLDLSRAGKVVGDFKEVKIKSMVDKIFGELEVSYKHVELVHKNLPKSIIANTRIEEVFQNLIVNALQAKKDSGILKLLVSCSERDDSWEFTVKDNGTGIDSTIKGNIFNPGFSTKGLREKGSGFGLSITKRIIEAHSGTISFTSQPGKGTTFKFVIPKLKEDSKVDPRI
jgi:signal transduction histidine kinase